MTWRARRRVLAPILAGAVLLAACTGVPTSSAPQVVQSVPVQPVQPVGAAPHPGDDPRTIVEGFLEDNASDDIHHVGAKAFLTNEARTKWNDSTQTQIFDSFQIGNFDSGSSTVTVSGRLIGTIDNQTGTYSPSLQGDGQGVRGTSVTVPIGLVDTGGQWRIDALSNGLLIDSSQFQGFYTQRFIYFYDQAQQRLVPDPRWSVLRDPEPLATWLMTQLVGQTRSSLSTDLPSIVNANQIKVDVGSTVTVDVPGAGQLDTGTRDRMAAQIAVTLAQVSPDAQIAVTDAGRAVDIPQVGGDTFTAAQFTDFVGPANRSPALYYIYRGGVVDANGRPLAGDIGSGQYGLRSVALASYGTPGIVVAGTSGSAGSGQLLVGRAGGALSSTGVTGALSRPAWAPNAEEVWVGAGASIFRVVPGGKPSPVQFSAETGTVAGKIVALRFSPEGARVALVIKADDGSSQIWVGDVVRSPDSVRVAGLVAISPLGIAVADVAWNDAFKLFAIGHEISGDEGGVYEVQCDGSVWTPRGIGNLPQNPDSISVAENVVAAVSAGGTVWQQQTTGTWVSPVGAGTVYGTNPVYLE